MAMERFTISMNEEEIDLFERHRTDAKMNKSAFVRLLIAEHENNVPAFIEHKELIKEISDLNTSIKEMILSEKFSDAEKLQIFEGIQGINKSIKNLIKKMPDN